MTEPLPTYKAADFSDVLAGFERFGYCRGDPPDDLEGFEHYCEALAFTVGDELSVVRNLLHAHDFGMGANDDFTEAESYGYMLKHAAIRILALAQIGVQAADHLKQLKANATPGEAS